MQVRIPASKELMWPTIKALRELGGSGSNDEIFDKVVELEGYTEAQQALSLPDKPMPLLPYRCGWARTYLKRNGLIDNSVRGIWVLLDKGARAREADITELCTEADKTGEKAEENGSEDWKSALIGLLLAEDPKRFERLCQYILREKGCTKVEVTGRPSDGGIDGRAVMRVNGILIYNILFQCKRYKGSVPVGAVRDFRGATQGRADRSLLITTGTFTSEAKKEASRDGVLRIDLIDGQELCDIMKELKLGVTVTAKDGIEKVSVDPDGLRRVWEGTHHDR